MDIRKGLICFVPAQMLMSWCTCKMVVNIQTKHDAKTNFFYLQSWCEISEMTYPTQHMHENDMRFSYQSDFRITIFYDSDSNSDSTRAYSDSDSDYKVYQNMWFQFWFRFQCFPKKLDSNSDSNKPGFDSDFDSGIIYNSVIYSMQS